MFGAIVGIGNLTPIETLLGPASERYFGSGHARVTHSIKDIMICPLRLELEAIGKACYPSDWSLNVDGSQREPHLSSIDAIVLVILSFELLAKSHSLDLRDLRISQLRLRSGASPCNPSFVPISVRAQSNADNRVVLDCQAGSIRMEVGIDNCSDGRCATSREHFRDLELVSNSEDLSPILVGPYDSQRQAVSSRHLVTRAMQRASWWGEFGRRRTNFLSVPDYILAMGQLAQVVVYASRRGDRSSIGNLWMRNLSITLDSTERIFPVAYSAFTTLVKDRLVPRLKKEVHDAEIKCHTSTGVSASARIAYSDVLYTRDNEIGSSA